MPLAGAVFALLSAQWSEAQILIDSGAIAGAISDSSHARLAGANVSLTRSDTGFQTATSADLDGEFRFEAIAPGDYTIRVEADGFANPRKLGRSW